MRWLLLVLVVGCGSDLASDPVPLGPVELGRVGDRLVAAGFPDPERTLDLVIWGSSDGRTWVVESPPIRIRTKNFQLIGDDERLLLLGHIGYGDGSTAYLTTGMGDWRPVSTPMRSYQAATANGVYVAHSIGEGGSTLHRSDDGETWTPAVLPDEVTSWTVAAGPDGFVLYNNGEHFLVSSDGRTWTEGPLHPHPYYGLSHRPKFMFRDGRWWLWTDSDLTRTSPPSVSRAYSSPDLVEWTPEPEYDDVIDFEVSGDATVIAGHSGRVQVGSAWQTVEEISGSHDVMAIDDGFLVAGSGTIWYSPDGLRWLDTEPPQP